MRIRRAIPRAILAAASACGLVIIGGTATTHASPPLPIPDQASAEVTVTDGYYVKQISCTPGMPGNPEAITWDPPGFTPGIGGSGTIHDANPQLGGHFSATWVPAVDDWDVQYEFC